MIAAINGPAVGVGATMTLPMDIRLASETARFGFVFARRGIVPEACSSWFLPAGRGHQHRPRVDDDRPGVRRRRGARARASCGRSTRPDDLLPAAYELAAEIADDTSAVSVAMTAPDAVADARRRPPDGRPPDRLAGHRQPRPLQRRPRGRGVVPREAPRRFTDQVPDDIPGHWPFWDEPDFDREA